MPNEISSASTHYWLLLDGAPTGPFDLAAIKSKLSSGEINREAAVCPLGSHSWVPLKQVLAAEAVDAIRVVPHDQPPAPRPLPVSIRPDVPPDPVIVIKPARPRGGLLLAVGALLLGICGTLAFVYWPSGYLLVGPASPKGTVIRNETRMTIAAATMTVSVGNQVASGIMTVEAQQITETQVKAVAAGEPTRFENKFLKDEATTRVSFGNEPERVTTDKAIFDGRTVQIEKVAGVWKQSLVGGNPDPVQARALQAEWTPEDLYPDRRLSLGETWTVSGSRLRRLCGMSDALSFDGTGMFTLADLVVRDGEKCAVVRAQIEVRATTLDEQNQEVMMEIAISGTIYRSLKSYLDVDADLSGQLRGQCWVPGERQAIKVNTAGPVTVRSNQSRR